MKSKLSTKNAVTLENVDGVDYLYFVDAQTKRTYRLPLSVLLEWIAQEGEFGGGSGSAITAPDATATVAAMDAGIVRTTIGGDVVEEVQADSRSHAASFDVDGLPATFAQSVSAEYLGERTSVDVAVDQSTTIRVTSQTGTNGDKAGTLLRAEMLVDDVPSSYAQFTTDFQGSAEVAASGSVSITAPVVALPTQGSATPRTTTEQEADDALPVVMTSSGALARAERWSDRASGVTATHSATVLTLTAAHHNQRIPVNTASNSVEVRIGTGLPAGFSCELRKTSASNAITFASGGGYITPVPYSTASSALNAVTSIFVESASHAETITVEPS